MVAAAFDSLLEKEENPSNETNKPDEIDERIIKAKTVMGLLSVAEGNAAVTRKHALKVYIIHSN